MSERCAALNSRDRQCRNNAVDGSKFCATHQGWTPKKAKPPKKKKKKATPKQKAAPKTPAPKKSAPKNKGGRPKKPKQTQKDVSTTYPAGARKRHDEEFDDNRELELARELVEMLEVGLPFPTTKLTELFELLLGRPLSLDETRAVVSYGINTAMKLVQSPGGAILEWVPDWQARKALSTELRQLSKWDQQAPSDPEPQNYYIVRMPCPHGNKCPMAEKK